ncbi:MAG: ComEC/Rec2 family competence protein [Bacteroidales bacterium]|nr:ComEC/Rec2 family competence protein [Bacteroidales bacterium]
MFERLYELGLSDEALALARGMLLGDKSGISSDVLGAFRTAGMSHIMAVSGLHVGILMSIIWMMFRPIEMLVGYIAPCNLSAHYVTGDVKRIAVIAVAAFYVWRIGAPPSAVRAALMLSLFMLGWMLRRSTSAWRCMAFAALVLVAWDPWTVGSVGFQLSFLAVAGILLFRPWLQSDRLPRWLRLVLLSVSAQWFTVPIVAYWFHQIPVLGWIQGLLVVPLMPLLMVLLVAGMLLPSLQFIAVPIEALTAWMGWVAQGIGRVERLLLGGHLHFFPTWWEVLLAELLLLAIILYLKVKKE